MAPSTIFAVSQLLKLFIMRIKEHGLVRDNFKNVSLLIGYILDFYFILYFDIKVKNRIIYGPQHVERLLELFHKQPEYISILVYFSYHKTFKVYQGYQFESLHL